jgi:hypothetical protein
MNVATITKQSATDTAGNENKHRVYLFFCKFIKTARKHSEKKMQRAIRAIETSNISALYSIDLKPIINYNIYGHSLLSKACGKGDIEIVKLLLSTDGIDINERVSIIRDHCVY